MMITVVTGYKECEGWLQKDGSVSTGYHAGS